ncbi:MAG: single-stranded-DNA-specific exonuclease RecJ [Clostridia bacterium]|nr:single-stranded-DNA-specific exonuclease RecJ [Clostridia bacterium]
MFKIRLASPSADVQALPGLPVWMPGLLASRGVTTEAEARRFLHPALDQLLPPLRLHQMAEARELLLRAREQGKKTVIYGDYDVDGVCASAILWETLGMLGMEREVYIPDRHKEGYGLNTAAVESLAQSNQVLVTVDCGITSVAEVRRARELGLDVIVTDHHRHGEELPPAQAVVSPLLGDYAFPFLCGAGVAWKLATALVGDKALPLLEIAALATIADMVPLIGENRAIAALGLEKLADTRRPGLRAVMERAGIRATVSSDQVAFQIAPRMNACGRMESARTALDMLLTRDRARAEELALKMEKLNQERKDQEAFVLKEALEQVGGMDLVREKAIVVLGEKWNSGVVGLAAGKVAEKYAYPTVALAREGDLCVGSARSAGEIDIHKALSRCAGLFERFGGHKQAAGLTLRAENVPAFREALSQAVAEQTGGRPVIPELLCDGEMALSDVTAETAGWLKKLEPFGMGNPAPRFLCANVLPLSFRAVGAEGRHLKCTFQQGRAVRDGIFFGGGDWAGRETGALTLAMSPEINEFRGKVSAECRLYAMEMLPDTLTENPEKEALCLMREARRTDGALPVITEAEMNAFMGESQGVLLLCRCLKTALRLRERFPDADFCLDRANDPRAFSAILLYGSAGDAHPAFRRVIFCDGDTGEGAAWQAALPGAELYALPRTRELMEALTRAFVDRDGLRRCYLALKSETPPDLRGFARQRLLTEAQALFALRVLEEIDLVTLSLRPFGAALLPVQKRGPEESGLFCLAEKAKEEMYGVHGV